MRSKTTIIVFVAVVAFAAMTTLLMSIEHDSRAATAVGPVSDHSTESASPRGPVTLETPTQEQRPDRPGAYSATETRDTATRLTPRRYGEAPGVSHTCGSSSRRQLSECRLPHPHQRRGQCQTTYPRHRCRSHWLGGYQQVSSDVVPCFRAEHDRNANVLSKATG